MKLYYGTESSRQRRLNVLNVLNPHKNEIRDRLLWTQAARFPVPPVPNIADCSSREAALVG